MAETVLDVLQMPNPWLNASSVSGGSNTTGRDWISVDSWRPWTEFTFETLLSVFQRPLMASWRNPPVVDPGSDFDHDIRDELSLDYFLEKFLFPIINRALERAAAVNSTREVFYVSPGSWCHGSGPPDWGLVAVSNLFEGKYNNILPGDTKLSAKWQPWMEQSQSESERYQWTLPISQVNTYAADSGCRYGYIITDQHFVALRFSKENVDLGSASSRPSRIPQSSHQRVASGETDLSSIMDAMSLDSFGAQSFIDNNLLNIDYQAPEYAVIPWSTSGRRRLTVKMALFCLCLMAAGGVTHIEGNYPPLDSWNQQDRHRFIHNTSGVLSKRVPPGATIVNPSFDEDQHSNHDNTNAELLREDESYYHRDPAAELHDDNQAYEEDSDAQNEPVGVDEESDQYLHSSTQQEQDDRRATPGPPLTEYSHQFGTNQGWFRHQEAETDVSLGALEPEIENTSHPGPSRSAQRSGRQYTEVKIQKRMLGGYKFAWKGGEVTTTKEEWKAEGDMLKLKKKFDGHYIKGRKP
ncbi:hypothetical protein CORC01_13290 [Colletotrichum orchidophilum]|uniref:Uncharacterized protein n=1 Tax=Colletotrichum orchidophilum TaxID=1209926 RepID=A0A1G4AQP8_9PEZI|nr:uncharacterized protein CORC01_13290 [Colletotrichum orchidophilum]OHE91425.1 hypothetical protein CORC01_13290 [Colletotrichum orchidophilum]